MDFSFPHRLALVAIIRNEASYIKEWIDYHMLLGVSKFYIYDNESTDNIKEVLSPYIESSLAEYVWFPGNGMQPVAYNDAVKRHRFDCEYMGFIDIDEFILPLTGENLLDIIDDIMATSPQAGGVSINWKSFGSSGHKKRPAGGVLENFTQRAPNGYAWSELPWKWDAHVKTIANPRCLKQCKVHNHDYFFGKYSFDENGNPVIEDDNFVEKIHRIRINHYFTKSLEEWNIKRERGNVGNSNWGALRPSEEFIWRDRNDVYDDAIIRYRERLRQRGLPTLSAPPSIDSRTLMQNLLDEFAQNTPQDWQGQLEKLMCYWALCRKRKKDNPSSLIDELFEQTIIAAMCNSMGAGAVAAYQVELIMSEWKNLFGECNSIKKNFFNICIEMIQTIIKNAQNAAPPHYKPLRRSFRRICGRFCCGSLKKKTDFRDFVATKEYLSNGAMRRRTHSTKTPARFLRTGVLLCSYCGKIAPAITRCEQL